LIVSGYFVFTPCFLSLLFRLIGASDSLEGFVSKMVCNASIEYSFTHFPSYLLKRNSDITCWCTAWFRRRSTLTASVSIVFVFQQCRSTSAMNSLPVYAPTISQNEIYATAISSLLSRMHRSWSKPVHEFWSHSARVCVYSQTDT